MGDHPHRGPNQ
jgi:hypothetical protein